MTNGKLVDIPNDVYASVIGTTLNIQGKLRTHASFDLSDGQEEREENINIENAEYVAVITINDLGIDVELCEKDENGTAIRVSSRLLEVQDMDEESEDKEEGLKSIAGDSDPIKAAEQVVAQEAPMVPDPPQKSKPKSTVPVEEAKEKTDTTTADTDAEYCRIIAGSMNPLEAYKYLSVPKISQAHKRMWESVLKQCLEREGLDVEIFKTYLKHILASQLLDQGVAAELSLHLTKTHSK